MKKAGYFIGQFPGPSHTYFWREIGDLKKLGLEVEVTSTRLPTTALATHEWAADSVAQTIYLYPMRADQAAKAVTTALSAFPHGWIQCFKSLVLADVPNLRERAKLISYIFMGARLAQIAKQRNWEHIHVAFCADAANIALFSKLLGGPAYSLTLHSALKDFGSNQIQKWSHAKFGTAVSKNLLEELKNSIGRQLPPTYVVPMGVDISKLVRTHAYEPWRPGQTLKIFCGARLTPLKGQLDLLHAAAAVVGRTGIEVEIRLAGEDMGADKWYTNELKSTAQKLRLKDNLKLLGILSENQVYQELQAAHLFVLASYSEGMSVAVMEAMGIGTPVITSDVDGLPDLIDDGSTGLLVPPGDPHTLSSKIIYLIEHPAYAVELANQAMGTIRQHHRSEAGAAIIANKMMA